ncbi:MAG: hypothetical protein H6832_10535 [Planctomycetes bacterium]|nr:hypothetical protein [Planctomycetota bacterium]
MTDDHDELKPEDMVPERVERFAMTVGSVWREARVSCPHTDILRAFQQDSLDAGQTGYVRFHVEEAACPYCQAVLEDLGRERAPDADAPLENFRERLRSSTIHVLREKRGRDSK